MCQLSLHPRAGNNKSMEVAQMYEVGERLNFGS
jgi:hypothetical protein